MSPTRPTEVVTAEQLAFDVAAPATAFEPHFKPAVTAAIAAAPRPRPCRCSSPIVAPDEDGDLCCIRCGRDT